MKAFLATYWRRMASGAARGLTSWLGMVILVPLSLPYAVAQTVRARLYHLGILKSKRLPRPVISIGNITVGGTGKTPVTACIARLLIERGFKIAVLSRGYGGSLEGQTAIVSDGKNILHTAIECGDEPYLLATTVPGLMVIIGSNRHSAGMLAMKELKPDVFLLDDGFQHLSLARDMNILLLDARRPFGNGRCLPAGLLREPESAARRADWIIHTRREETATDIPGLEHIPQISACHELTDAIPLAGGDSMPLQALAGSRIIAFAGIAEPESFFDGLRNCGINLATTISLPDHAVYNTETVATIAQAAQTHDAVYILTTEKDGVKLGQLPEALATRTLLVRLSLKVDALPLLMTSLRNLLQK